MIATVTKQNLLNTVEAIRNHTPDRSTADASLAEIVLMIGNVFEVDACSVYRIEAGGKMLRLQATIGLRQDAISRISMTLDEGLAGLVAQNQEIVSVEKASEHPRFKYFPEVGEDPFVTFLGLPVKQNGKILGVLVVQMVELRTFSQTERQMLETVARHIAPLLCEV